MTSSMFHPPSRGYRLFSCRGLTALLLAGLLLALAGCATPYRLDSQVNSFSILSGTPAGGYRFERLPLQQADPHQPRVEALAEAALARAGLRRDDAAPQFAVQAWGLTPQMTDPWGGPGYRDPWWGPAGGWGGLSVGSGGHVGLGIGIGMPLGYAGAYGRTVYRREVGLVVRELASGQVLYQTQAASDGPWLDPDRAIGSLFDAALQGFPNPPVGPRRVNVLVPR